MVSGKNKIDMVMAGGKDEKQGDKMEPVIPEVGEGSAKTRPVANEEADLGNALRKAYQETVEEEIPTEMLDLLKRLN